MSMFEYIQYRERLAEFPSWNKAIQYSDWADIPADKKTFGSYTQFRIKSVEGYLVSNGDNEEFHLSKDDAMVILEHGLNEGQVVTISKMSKPVSSDKIPAIQMRAPGGRNSYPMWETVHFDSILTISQPYEFRLRPEYYYSVVYGDITEKFDDVSQLADYVVRLIQRGITEFQVLNVNY